MENISKSINKPKHIHISLLLYFDISPLYLIASNRDIIVI